MQYKIVELTDSYFTQDGLKHRTNSGLFSINRSANTGTNYFTKNSEIFTNQNLGLSNTCSIYSDIEDSSIWSVQSNQTEKLRFDEPSLPTPDTDFNSNINRFSFSSASSTTSCTERPSCSPLHIKTKNEFGKPDFKPEHIIVFCPIESPNNFVCAPSSLSPETVETISMMYSESSQKIHLLREDSLSQEKEYVASVKEKNAAGGICAPEKVILRHEILREKLYQTRCLLADEIRKVQFLRKTYGLYIISGNEL